MVEHLQSLLSLKGIELRPHFLTGGRAELAAIFSRRTLPFMLSNLQYCAAFSKLDVSYIFWYLEQDSKIFIEIKRVAGKFPPSAMFSKRCQGFGEPFADSFSNLIA